MSHYYLIDTYAYITQRLDAAHRHASDTGDDQQMKQMAAGRIEALSQFERFLSDNFDAKLPRRLARQRKKVDI